jgi:uncharacterized lipoprotein
MHRSILIALAAVSLAACSNNAPQQEEREEQEEQEEGREDGFTDGDDD